MHFGVTKANKYLCIPYFKKNIQKSTTNVLDLEMTIARIFENLVRANSEFNKIQGSQLHQSHDLATDLKTKLEKLQDNEVDGLLTVFGKIYNQLVRKIVSKNDRNKYIYTYLFILEEHSLIKIVAKHE